jgi:predicted SprT family Zn-dependent metalloprotease
VHIERRGQEQMKSAIQILQLVTHEVELYPGHVHKNVMQRRGIDFNSLPYQIQGE